MSMRLSVLMITKNSGGLLEASLSSVKTITDEILVVDDNSSDNTVEIAKKYGAKVFKKKNTNLGLQRAFGLSKCLGNWILMLDADEIVSTDLAKEIKGIVEGDGQYSGYYIPYQNHFLGKPIYYGGEDYKILRLFKKDKSMIASSQVHEHVAIQGKTGLLHGKINHFSYRSILQTFSKFTLYARLEAKQKIAKGEKTSIKTLVLYPLHMFWARYIKDKGYKDYFLRIILDVGFAYMEFLTYFLMFFEHKKADKA